MLQVVAAAAKSFKADLEIADTLTAEVRAKTAFLEGEQAAADRSLSLFDLVGDGGQIPTEDLHPAK